MIEEARIRSLHEAVKELTSERIEIIAVPGSVKNEGNNIPAVEVIVGHVPTKKVHHFIYRGLSSNFKKWLKEQVDKIDNQ